MHKKQVPVPLNKINTEALPQKIMLPQALSQLGKDETTV